MKAIAPHFVAKITLYPTHQNGRKSLITGEWYGCPCKFHEADFSAWDCRILINGEPFAPGETKEFAIVFLTAEIAPLFGLVERFFIWEGRVIGEAHRIR